MERGTRGPLDVFQCQPKRLGLPISTYLQLQRDQYFSSDIIVCWYSRVMSLHSHVCRSPLFPSAPPAIKAVAQYVTIKHILYEDHPLYLGIEISLGVI